MATTDSAPSSPEPESEKTPTFRTPEQYHRREALGQLRHFLSELTEQPACLCCNNGTTTLLNAGFKHDAFHCTVPIPVCYTCLKEPPFVLKAVNERAWWTLGLLMLAVAFGIKLQWLLCVLTLSAAAVVFARMKAPRRISGSERRAEIRSLLSRISPIQSLLQLEPEISIEVPLREPSLAGSAWRAIDYFDNSLVFHEQFYFLIDYGDLNRSSVNVTILTLFSARIMELTKKALAAEPLNVAAAVQVDIALLPGRRVEFEIQIIPESSPRLRQTLATAIKALPPVSVRWPVMFMVRRCREMGAANFDQFAEPFLSWRNHLGWLSGVSYAEKAMHVFELSSDEFPVDVTIDECAAWRKIGRVPDSLAVLHADLLTAGNRIDEALAVFEEQLRESPDDPNLRFQYAMQLAQADQRERSAAVCQALVTEFPQFTDCYGFLAYLQLTLERPDDAKKTITAAPTENRSPRFWLTAAQISNQLHEVDTALGCLNTAILKNQEFPDPLLMRAKILAHQGNYAQALNDIERYQNLAGVTDQTIQMHAELLDRLGMPEAAIMLFTEALQKEPGQILLLLMRAHYFADAGKLELARADCDVILKDQPQIAHVLELRARLHIEFEQPDQALADADLAIEYGQQTSKVFMYRGIAKRMLEDYEGASDDLSTACELGPDNLMARYHWSRVKAIQGQLHDAMADLNIVLESAKEWVEARMARGFLALTSGDAATAAMDFDEAIRLQPANVDAYRGRSLAFEAAGKQSKALTMLDKALLLDPDNTDCRMARSNLLLADNDLKAARKDLDSILTSAPKLLPALFSRAQVRMQQGELDGARQDFDEILKDHPDFTPALIGRSVVFDQKGDQDRSMQDLEAATLNTPEYKQEIEIQRLMLKTSIAHQKENFDEAILASTQVIEMNPEHRTAYRIRAGSYWYSEQFVEALQDYTYLIETADEPDAGEFNGRGQVHAELGDYDLALKDLEQAIRIARLKNDAGLPFSLSGMGKTLTGLGRLDEADVAFRESLSIQPDNAWLHFNRGLLYLARKERRNAGLCFELSLRLTNPRLSPRKRAKAKGFLETIQSEPYSSGTA